MNFAAALAPFILYIIILKLLWVLIVFLTVSFFNCYIMLHFHHPALF